MKITCKSCEQPIEVDDGADLSGVQCPVCGAALAAPNVSAPASGPKRSRNLLSTWLTPFFAMAAFLLALYCVYRLHNPDSFSLRSVASTDPLTTIRNFFRLRHREDHWSADGAFWRAHKTEISKTLEIVSTNAQGHYLLTLARYSVGDKVFRQGLWLKKVGDQWYIVPYLSTYAPTPEIAQHLGWFEEANKKKDAWEKESADRVQ